SKLRNPVAERSAPGHQPCRDLNETMVATARDAEADLDQVDSFGRSSFREGGTLPASNNETSGCAGVTATGRSGRPDRL
ncbi:MAG TPA: hypothetical protein VFJ13_00260, partial [Paracoccaceae bacterium]|nr:hypothetical protein [Paracoccaceae bacterium]